jgi:hypothetical protein
MTTTLRTRSSNRWIAATLSSATLAIVVVGGGCNNSEAPVNPPQKESRPVMYGTDGNRGVTAPSAGVPQSVDQRLGGEVQRTRADPTVTPHPVAGSSAAADAPAQPTTGTGTASGATGGAKTGTSGSGVVGGKD